MTPTAAITTVVAWLREHSPEDHAQLRTGASAQELARVEATLGRPLPAAMREAYAIHDGAEEISGCFAGLEWLCLDAGLHYRARLAGMVAESPDDFGTWWSDSLFPFATDGSRFYLTVDLATGRVVEVDWGEEPREMAPSFGALLERYARGIEAGDFVVDEEGITNRWGGGPGFERLPSPSASLVERLAMSRRPASSHDLATLRAMPVAAIDRDLEGRPHREAVFVAETLGRAGEAWARAFLARHASKLGYEEHVRLAKPCLPPEETFAWALAHRPAARDDMLIAALVVLQDPRALDWIEAQRDLVPGSGWGLAVYACGLDWPRARSWIARGRPLSLLALDALAYPCPDRSGSDTTTPIPVTDRAELARVLAEVAAKDDVPRVRKAVASVRRLYGLG